MPPFFVVLTTVIDVPERVVIMVIMLILIRFVRPSATRFLAFGGLVCVVFAGLLHSAALSATQADDPAWRNFQHALGAPALIGANADHMLAAAAWRPIPEPISQDIDVERFRLGSDLFHEGHEAFPADRVRQLSQWHQSRRKLLPETWFRSSVL